MTSVVFIEYLQICGVMLLNTWVIKSLMHPFLFTFLIKYLYVYDTTSVKLNILSNYVHIKIALIPQINIFLDNYAISSSTINVHYNVTMQIDFFTS